MGQTKRGPVSEACGVVFALVYVILRVYLALATELLRVTQ